jgi:hypothetical protein
MKVTHKSPDGRWSVELEGDGQTDIFQAVGRFQEVFGQNKCGRCGNDDVRFVVRNNDDNLYHEIHCKDLNCRAKLAFGAHKTGGGLFPKRKDGDDWLPNGGWVRWNKEKGVNE